MVRTTSARQYGKQSKRSKAERLFAELLQSPVRKPAVKTVDDSVSCLASHLSAIQIEEESKPLRKSSRKPEREISLVIEEQEEPQVIEEKDEVAAQLPVTVREAPSHEVRVDETQENEAPDNQLPTDEVQQAPKNNGETEAKLEEPGPGLNGPSFRVLTWDDVCPPGDRIDKIAEASYSEVYRVTNERGMSIIKVIRLPSPIKPQTKAQVRSGLVDEKPHSEEDVKGELQISEWLADIPGFVVYKERYIVQGKTSRQLLETHQTFQNKLKRQDPGRAQFYPSPSRYLDDTRFLVVELGDAGTALEDWQLTSDTQLWDIFLLEAVALARAEELVMFEHRDLHEGNVCVKQVRPPRQRDPKAGGFFGYSGLELTILDYGLSRAEDLSIDDSKPVAFDLEKDFSLFTSTHAMNCKVYQQMRSFLLRADRKRLPPDAHDTPYAIGIDGPLSWDVYAPYTNVLWLAYLYEYMVDNFKGKKRELANFKKETAELWKYLNPDAPEDVPWFECAADIVGFALEAGWVREEQLQGSSASMIDREDSIIVSRDNGDGETLLRRSPRRRRA